jgi:hypothetical protein
MREIMDRAIKAITVIIAVGMSLIAFSTAQSQVTNESSDVEMYRARYKGIYDRLPSPHIYGKIVDQEGNPVANAEVSIVWESAAFLIGKKDYRQTMVVRSDRDGRWNITIEKPHRAFVEGVKKNGYEYSSIHNENSYTWNLVEKKTTQESPIISVIRKVGETTFLIHREDYKAIRVSSSHDQTSTLDLLAKYGANATVTSYWDLQVAVDYGVATRKWTVTYIASNGTDGIVTGDELLYEAPQDGYQKEVVLNGPPWPQHLYVRSRTPAIYSRLDLEHNIRKYSNTNEDIQINFKAWINPYGERNLEYESDLTNHWELRKQLEKAAKSALGKNERPSKPDLPKLIQEAKDKAEKDKVTP